MQQPQKPQAPRPYWHVDLKWVLSLLLCAALAAWLAIVVAYRVTDRDVAVALTKNALTLFVNSIQTDGPQGDQAAREALRQQILASPTKSINPLPGYPVTITEADLNLTGEQLKQKIFGPIVDLAGPLYDKGAQAVAAEHTSDPAAQKKFANDVSSLTILNRDNHNKLMTVLVVVGIVAVLLAAGAIWMSSRWGRLVTPGVVLLVVAVPMLLVFTGLASWVSQPADAVAQPQDVTQLLVASRGAFKPAVAAGQQVYLAASIAGAVLLVVAAGGKVVFGLLQKAKAGQPKQ